MANIYELSNQDDLNDNIKAIMKEGRLILKELTQPKYSPLTQNEMLNKFKSLSENNHD